MIDYKENLQRAKEHWEKEAETWEIGRGIHYSPSFWSIRSGSVSMAY
jgi:hypothetical protein